MSKIISMHYEQGVLKLIDQRKLPGEFVYFECRTYREVEFAIKDMVVRGAPAIGATAAYGAILAARQFMQECAGDRKSFLRKMEKALDFLNCSRPTAVNLMWAVKKMKDCLAENRDASDDTLMAAVEQLAHDIFNEDRDLCISMGKHGNTLVPEGAVILTHCNTGALAAAGPGTALAVIREAHNTGKKIQVYADETRPRMQGGRLTAWELMQEGIPSKLIVDSTAATLIRDGKIDLILVGADRIASNGDAANKIGTFMLSVLAKTYNVPFYVVAPVTTIDFEMEKGDEIEIEERDASEITHINGIQTAPEGMEVYNPAFDVTPQENITAIVTDRGIIFPPFNEGIAQLKESVQ
ncbi:MAG: S-methyl-5-thioribose-1-phosphate isomerase [Spirochaetales bacterium]|nr:S-methyl-5-thioribose-1-phosphate isomerase [Spirochaetales bacterium]